MNPFLSRRAGAIYQAIWSRFDSWANANGYARATITTAQLCQYLEARRAVLKRSTLALELAALRAYFNGAVLDGTRTDNPTAGIKLPRPEVSESDAPLIRGITPAESQALWYRISNSTPPLSARDKAMVMLMLGHGLRVAEICSVTWERFGPDFTAARITGKGNKTRPLFVSPAIAVALHQWALCNPSRAGIDRVFPITTTRVRAIIKRLLRSIGIDRPGISCHALRHAYGTIATITGCPIQVLSQSMGHSSSKTTEVYVRAAALYQGNPGDYVAGFLEGNNEAKGLLPNGRGPAGSGPEDRSASSDTIPMVSPQHQEAARTYGEAPQGIGD